MNRVLTYELVFPVVVFAVVSASIWNLPSPSEIASTGHSPWQVPQETHSSEILYAIESLHSQQKD